MINPAIIPNEDPTWDGGGENHRTSTGPAIEFQGRERVIQPCGRLDWVVGFVFDAAVTRFAAVFSPILYCLETDPRRPTSVRAIGGRRIPHASILRTYSMWRLEWLQLGRYYQYEGKRQRPIDFRVVSDSSRARYYKRKMRLEPSNGSLYIAGSTHEVPERLSMAIEKHAIVPCGVTFFAFGDASGQSDTTIIVPCAEILRSCYIKPFDATNRRRTGNRTQSASKSSHCINSFDLTGNAPAELPDCLVQDMLVNEPRQLLRRALVHGKLGRPRPMLIRPPYNGDVVVSGCGYEHRDDDGELVFIASQLSIEPANSNTNHAGKKQGHVEIIGVSSAVEANLRHAPISRHTERAFERAFEEFKEFAQHQLCCALPATPTTVRDFFLSCGRAGKSYSVMRQYRDAIAYRHREAGLPDPTSDNDARRAFRGLVKGLDKAAKISNAALEGAVESIVHHLNIETSLTDLRDRALVLVLWEASLTRAELRSVTHENVMPSASGIKLKVSASQDLLKTRIVEIPYGPEGRCAVRALQEWMRRSGIISGPVFRKINRHGQISGAALHEQGIAQILKARATDIGEPALSALSFRFGRLVQAVLDGEDEETVLKRSGLHSESLPALRKALEPAFDVYNRGGADLAQTKASLVFCSK